MRQSLVLFIAALVLTFGCGKKSPTAPDQTPPPPAATPTRIINLSGNMAFGNIQVGQSFRATLNIGNAGTSPLTISGFTGTGGIANVTQLSWTSGTIAAGASQEVVVTFTPPLAQTYSGTITVNGDQTSGTNTIAFTGTGTTAGLPIFTRSGFGNTVFDFPNYITRFRIQGRYTGSGNSNFIVHIVGGSAGTRFLVNEILRTSNYDGIHLTGGPGSVEITSSGSITWTLTEVR